MVSKIVDDYVIVAFNRHIAESLRRRNLNATTLHSQGLTAIRARYPSTQVEPDKYRNLIRQWLNVNRIQGKQGTLSEDIHTLLFLMANTLTDSTDLDAMHQLRSRHGLALSSTDWDIAKTAVGEIMALGVELAPEQVDFLDMVWLPAYLDLPVYLDYRFVMVDEAQDLSAAQLNLALKLCSERSLFVGDRHQAIYGWAGADAQSMDCIQSSTEAVQLPLSICYRCPRSHIDLAAEIVPQIEPRPAAPEGVIEEISKDDLPDRVQPGDLVLSRYNVSLVTACLKMLQRNIRASIRGRDIGRAIQNTIRETSALPNFRVTDLPQCLKYWEWEKLTDLDPDDLAGREQVIDRAKTVTALYNHHRPRDLQHFIGQVDGLFRANPDVWLSSVHRAKGLEADRVWILNPEEMPARGYNKDWEIQQEWNILYVALTRSRHFLGMAS